MDKKILTHNGLEFTYYQTGTGDTNVFLQHGYSDTALCWGSMPDDLGKNHRVTLLDARGHGHSAKPKNGYTLDAMSADVMALFDHLGLEKPFYIGHSMGGSIGARIAARYPNRLRAAALIDPAFREETNEDRDKIVADIREDVRRLKQKSRDEIIALIHDKHPDWPEVFVGPAADGELLMSLDMIEIIRNINKTWKDDLAASICPILVITADVNLGAIVTPAISARIQKAHSNVSVRHIPGAGHSIQREKYAQTLTVIKTFFKVK